MDTQIVSMVWGTYLTYLCVIKLIINIPSYYKIFSSCTYPIKINYEIVLVSYHALNVWTISTLIANYAYLFYIHTDKT